LLGVLKNCASVRQECEQTSFIAAASLQLLMVFCSRFIVGLKL